MNTVFATIKRHRWCSVTLLAAAVVMLALSLLTTLKGDDMLYGTVIGVPGHKPVSGLADLWQSWSNFYAIENGRLANYIAIALLALSSHATFSALNALALVLLLAGIVRATAATPRVATLAAMLLCVLTLVPYPGETMLWLDGSLNYLWTATATLWLWIWACGTARKPAIALLAAAVAAGAMNEATTIPVAMGAVATLLARRQRPTRAQATAIAGYCAGVLIIVCSPGAWARLANDGLNTGGASAGATLIAHGKVVAKLTCTLVLPLLAWIILAAQGRKSLRNPLLWIMAGHLLLLFALGDGRKLRLYFPYSVTAMMVLVQAAAPLLERRARAARWLGAALAALCVALAGVALQRVHTYWGQFTAIEAQIAAAPANCVLPAQHLKTGRWVAPNHFDSASHPEYNSLLRDYYGKQEIAFVRPALLERWHKGDLARQGTAMQLHSSHPAILTGTVTTFAGEEFALLPIGQRHIARVNSGATYALSPDNRLNSSGFNPAYGYITTPVSSQPFFALLQGTQHYLVLPAIDPDVQSVTIPTTAGPVTLTRPQG